MSKRKCAFCGSVVYKLKRHLIEVHKITDDECREIMSTDYANVHRDNEIVAKTFNDTVVFTRSKTETFYRKRCAVERSRSEYHAGNKTTVVPVKKAFPFADALCENLAVSNNKNNRVKEIMCFVEKLWIKMDRNIQTIYSPSHFMDVFMDYAKDHKLVTSSRRRYAWHVIAYLTTIHELEGNSRKKNRLSMTLKKVRRLCGDDKKIIARDTFVRNLETCEYTNVKQ